MLVLDRVYIQDRLEEAERKLQESRTKGESICSQNLHDRKCRILRRLLLSVQKRNSELF